MILGILKTLLGGGAAGASGAVREVAEVFRPNAEAADKRAAQARSAALQQMAAEFGLDNRGRFDRLIDGINRLPRPAMALGTLGLLASAMIDPVWFGERMAGLALVPEPLWWLLGAVVSFYFGARYQAKGQEFQRSITATLDRAPKVVETVATLRALRADSPGAADTGSDAGLTEDATEAAARAQDNPALDEWRRASGPAGGGDRTS